MKTADAVILRALASVAGAVPSAKLVKLVYLIDYVYFQHYGHTLTGFQYQWDGFGPDALGHATISEAQKLAERDLVKVTCEPNIYGGTTTEFAVRPNTEIPSLHPEAEMVIADVIRQYGKLSVHSITSKSKQTEPFKSATQYSLLSMKQLAPASKTDESDRQAFLIDLKENGTLSLEEVKRRYGLA